MPIPPKPNSDELAKRYGLEPVPESVQRLTQLVARRDSWGEDIATVINQDQMLTGRLLSAANPKAQKEADYKFTTTQECMSRVGMNWVLLLAMVTPLLSAVHKTFSTMLSVELQQTRLGLMPQFKEEHFLGEVAFTGKASGVVHLRMLRTTALVIATRMLGLQPEEITSDDEIHDVIGELSNIIAGNLRSNLSDAHLDCKLSPPKISCTPDFAIFKPSGNVAERYGFRAQEIDLFVDISVNPKSV